MRELIRESLMLELEHVPFSALKYSAKKKIEKKHMSILKYGKIGSLFSDHSHFCNAYLIILLPTKTRSP